MRSNLCPGSEPRTPFNVNQHRVRLGIQQSIDTYGVPEIYEQDGGLRVRVGDIAGVQTLFAISDDGRPAYSRNRLHRAALGSAFTRDTGRSRRLRSAIRPGLVPVRAPVPFGRCRSGSAQ